MGVLVDRFYIKLKPAWEEVDFEKIYEQIPPSYHPLFSALWNELHSLEDIMNHDNIETVTGIVEKFEKSADDAKFFDRYRGECLSQFLRTTFFDTMLICQNQSNIMRLNVFHVLNDEDMMVVSLGSGCVGSEDTVISMKVCDVINEEIWKSEIPIDQKLVQTTIVNLEEDSPLLGGSSE